MRLTDHDASFLYNETASGPMHAVTIIVLEGNVTFNEVFAHVEARIHLIPRFRQKLSFVPMNIAHAKWVDDPEFDLANHVKSASVPEGASFEDAVQYSLELGEPLLDRSRSLWLFYVIENVEGNTLFVQLAHHAMVDGASAVDISLLMFDFEPDYEPPPPDEDWAPKAETSMLERWNEALTENYQSMTKNVTSALNFSSDRNVMLQRATDVMRRIATDQVIMAPWNAGAVGPKRHLKWLKYDFGEFRSIRRAIGGTVNDLVLTVVVEAAARYLKKRGAVVDNQQMRLMCPVNVRREGESGALGNRVSAMYPVLPAWPMEIEERFARVCAETTRLKADQEPQALELLMESMPSIPPVAMAQTLLVSTPFDPTLIAARVPSAVVPGFAGGRPPFFGFNFTCTNVPGVQVPQYVAGHQVLYPISALMLSGTLGYGVAVTSFNQQLVFSLVCEPRLMPDLEVMHELVGECFVELASLAEQTQPAVEKA